MSQQKGRLLLIRIGDGESPQEFTNMCGFRARSFNMSANEVDTTVPDCDDPGGPVQRRTEPGITNRTFSGSGLFESNTVGRLVADKARLAAKFDAQVVVPGYGTFEGEWMLSEFEWSGEMEGNMEFSATFMAAGPLEFEAESAS